MSNLIAVGYPSTTAAEEVMQTLGDLQAENLIQLQDAVIVERTDEGKVKLRQPGPNAAGLGALGGAAWGGLIGLLFFVPLLGMAMGAGAGALAGKAAGNGGINEDFLQSLGSELQPGNAALVALVAQATPDKVLQRLHGQYGGHLLHTSLSNEDEAALRDAINQAQAASRQQ